MKLVIVSGLSGAGKTVALKQYEDLGYYCVDNLPLGLLASLSLRARSKRYQRLAVGIDARASTREIARFQKTLARHKERGVDTQVLFLTASDDSILRRYSETRRRHPLTGERLTLAEAIQRERELLGPIADVADVTIDTSALNLHELREAINRRLPEVRGHLSLVLTSFGYKNGLPEGADYVFDVRSLPNPFWRPALAPLDGRSPEVIEFFAGEPVVAQMTQDIKAFLEKWLPGFQAQDRAYVTVAVGCTGGRHRSVHVIEALAAAFRGRYDPVVVKHRELE